MLRLGKAWGHQESNVLRDLEKEKELSIKIWGKNIPRRTENTEVPKQSLTLHVSRKEGNHAIGNKSL